MYWFSISNSCLRGASLPSSASEPVIIGQNSASNISLFHSDYEKVRYSHPISKHRKEEIFSTQTLSQLWPTRAKIKLLRGLVTPKISLRLVLRVTIISTFLQSTVRSKGRVKKMTSLDPLQLYLGLFVVIWIGFTFWNLSSTTQCQLDVVFTTKPSYGRRDCVHNLFMPGKLFGFSGQITEH